MNGVFQQPGTERMRCRSQVSGAMLAVAALTVNATCCPFPKSVESRCRGGFETRPTRFSSGTMACSKTFSLIGVLVDLSENTK